MIKIWIPPIEQFNIQTNKGELNHILKDGVMLNPKTELVDSFEECDFVFADFRHLTGNPKGYQGNVSDWSGDKLIIIDYSDRPELFNVDCLYYFKRNCVWKGEGKFRSYPREYRPISYCIKNDWLDYDVNFYEERDIDISVFFRRESERNKVGMIRREMVAEFVESNFSHKNIHVGIVNSDGEAGRMSAGEEYVRKMLRSKIVVNCNPDLWEGDYRLFETLSCGAMVIVDRMITPAINPFEDRKHLVYYDYLEHLGNEIEYYLENDEERKMIANNGYTYALEYHKTSDRIDEILEVIGR
tara:strand:+ start:2622 stop:3518 length:897 start_codon:yes stop_codon:yes gene_type:complete